MGHAALGEIGRNFPVLGVDPLHDPGATQRFQSSDMRTDEGVGVAADPLDFSTGSLQMRAWAVDAGLIRHVADVEVRRPRFVGEPDRLNGDDVPARDLVELGMI